MTKIIITLILIINSLGCTSNHSDKIIGEPIYIFEIRNNVSQVSKLKIDSTKYFYLNSNLFKKIHYVLPNIIQETNYDALGNKTMIRNCFNESNCSIIKHSYDKNRKWKSEILNGDILDYYIIYSYKKRKKEQQLDYYHIDSTLFKVEIKTLNNEPISEKIYYKDTALIKSVKKYDFEKNEVIKEKFNRKGELIHVDSTSNKISRKLLLKYNPRFSKTIKKGEKIINVKVDDIGNWIEREVYELGKLKYKISRDIKY